MKNVLSEVDNFQIIGPESYGLMIKEISSKSPAIRPTTLSETLSLINDSLYQKGRKNRQQRDLLEIISDSPEYIVTSTSFNPTDEGVEFVDCFGGLNERITGFVSYKEAKKAKDGEWYEHPYTITAVGGRDNALSLRDLINASMAETMLTPEDAYRKVKKHQKPSIIAFEPNFGLGISLEFLETDKARGYLLGIIAS